MTISSGRAFRVAAILGFLGVALGAMGAHLLKDTFALRPHAEEWWQKAVLYHLVHTLVMLLLACVEPFRPVPWLLFGSGILLFSGSLYLLALTGILALGIVTPLGGLCFLSGWFGLAFGRVLPVRNPFP